MLIFSNQLLFFIQSIIVSAFVLISARLGAMGLTAFMAVCWILGNFFSIQQATLFGFEAVTSDPFAIGATLAMTFLYEYHGKTIAKKTVHVGITLILFFVLMSIIQISYSPNSFDVTHTHFYALLSRMPRIVFASVAVSGFTQILNLFIFKHLKNLFGPSYFTLTTALAVMSSQCVDTILFTLCALGGNVHSIAQIIIFSTGIKWIATAISLPFIHAYRKKHHYKNISSE